jgi:hypothetical protein
VLPVKTGLQITRVNYFPFASIPNSKLFPGSGSAGGKHLLTTNFQDPEFMRIFEMRFCMIAPLKGIGELVDQNIITQGSRAMIKSDDKRFCLADGGAHLTS